MAIMPWQLCICVCKSPFWCHTNPCVKVPEQTWGQPQQEPLLVAPLITCADGDALTRPFCALIGPRGQMRSFIGLQLTQGSKKEVVIKTESRSIFLLPGRQQTAFCWAISVFFHRVIQSVCVPFFFLLSAFLSFLSFFSLFSLFPLSFHLTWSSSVFLNSSPFSVRGGAVLSPPRFHSFPYSSLQKIVLCEMRQSRLASSISESQRDCKEVVKMTPPLGNTWPY